MPAPDPDGPVRRGARSPDLVPEDVLSALAAGAPSVNHMEQMALDMGALLETAFPELSGQAERLRVTSFLSRLRAGGDVLRERWGEDAAAVAADHASDTVRGWAAFAAVRPGMSPLDATWAVLRFADDHHFAVREWAWLAARPAVVARPIDALEAVQPLARYDSPRLRRFASEVTRPRGVWGRHVPELKARPWRAAPLLDLLVADEDRYVRTSVGNWLNDAARGQPGWVREQCSRWGVAHGPSVRWVSARALRSLPEPGVPVRGD